MLANRDPRRATLAIALVIASATASVAGYGGGGGTSRPRPPADCLVGLAGAPAGTTIECSDCDPSCDADQTNVSNGSCTFRLQVCVNLPGVAGCDARELRSVSARPRALFAMGAIPEAPLAAASTCGGFADVIVRTRKGGSKPGRRKLRLTARSSGRPRQADTDVFRLVCRPTAPGEACGTVTTTTAPVTTTTIPVTCGDGILDPGEQCDAAALAGETCVSRGFSSGTLACAASCTFDVSGCTAPPSTCTVDMDATCPDTRPVCGATFAGGAGCFFEGKAGCYDSGLKSYKIAAGETLTMRLAPGIVALEVFFAAEGGAAGTMTFRDGMGTPVGGGLTTNGNCLASMPPRQQRTFPVPVETIEVTASGGVVWVDSLAVSR